MIRLIKLNDHYSRYFISKGEQNISKLTAFAGPKVYKTVQK